jgi:hypothetical protein
MLASVNHRLLYGITKYYEYVPSIELLKGKIQYVEARSFLFDTPEVSFRILF